MNVGMLVMMMVGQVGEAPAPGPSAAEVMRLVHADLARRPPAERVYLRYFSFHNRTEKEREAIAPVYWGHPQHLSRSARLPRPASVAGGLLMRVSLKDYGWTAETWEKLPDPWFASTTVTERIVIVDHPAGKPWKDGKTYDRPFQVKQTFEDRVPGFGFWLYESAADKARLDEIYLWTKSYVPCVRADWFLNATAAQQGRDGYGYYDFLRIKTESDFFKMVGFDEKLAKNFRFELRGAVAISGVTRKPRALARFDSLGGACWITFDFKVAKGEKNPLKIIGRKIGEKPDGKEGYAHGANRFLFTYAANGEGKLVDAVPGEIASHHFSASNDKQIHPNISCYDCHGPSGGLQDIDEFWRNQLNPPIELVESDPEEAQALKEQYLRDLKVFLKSDRAIFEGAVVEATGWDSKKYAAAYTAEFTRYEDARVTTAWAANDLGLTEDDFRDRLFRYIKLSDQPGSTLPRLDDDVFASLVHKGPRAKAVPIRNWEEAIPEAYRVMRAMAK